MSEEQSDFRREVRDTIVKSSLTGVAATVLAVTLSSPAGLGGMIGTSLASGAADPNAATTDAYATLPAYPAPLTAAEVAEIRGQLAVTAATLALTREATEDDIARIRTIVAGGSDVAEASVVSASLRPTFREVEPVAAPQVAERQAVLTPASYAAHEQPADANLELADLLFSYDTL